MSQPPNQSTQRGKPHVIVVGAGVAGLTAANILLTLNYNVTIVAEYFPGDLAIGYTSPWAGAHWRSAALNSDKQLQEFEAVSYRKFMQLARTRAKETGVMILPSQVYFDQDITDYRDPWFRDLVEEEMMINSPHYLGWLLNEFKRHGGKTQRRILYHLSDVFWPGVDAVVNCTGLGSRDLGGVADSLLYPTRGQTVIVHAPHVKRSVNYFGKDSVEYVIPRSDGTVVLGGTVEADNWNPHPTDDTAKAIMMRTLKLCPELATPDGRPPEIVRHAVGLRPTRRGGPRIEVEHVALPKSDQRMLVVHGYGYGGFGYQASWGAAQYTAHLVHKALKARPSANL